MKVTFVVKNDKENLLVLIITIIGMMKRNCDGLHLEMTPKCCLLQYLPLNHFSLLCHVDFCLKDYCTTIFGIILALTG